MQNNLLGFFVKYVLKVIADIFNFESPSASNESLRVLLDNLSSSILWSCESPTMITLSFACLCFVALYPSDKTACFCACFEDSDVHIRCFALVFYLRWASMYLVSSAS